MSDVGKPKVALVSYYTTENTTLIFVIKPELDAPLVYDLQVTQDDIAAALAQLRESINGRTERYPLPIDALRPWSRPFERFEGLSEALLRFVPAVSDCDLLCLEPHGPLHGLPLHALRCSDGRYLIEHFGVSYVPSATVLKHCQTRNPARLEPEDATLTGLTVGVGASDDWEDVRTGFELDAKELWSGLPLQQLERLVGSADASKTNVVAALPEKRLVHIACHGLFDPLSPMRSGLLLTDGTQLSARQPLPDFDALAWEAYRAERILSAQDLLGIRLKAELVSLRACQTGVSKVEAGDELLGLVRALVYAGAPSVLVSLWNVSPQSSLELLQRFYRSWLTRGAVSGARTPKWRALQEAVVNFLHDESSPAHYRHFYHWAPFVLIGDWL